MDTWPCYTLSSPYFGVIAISKKIAETDVQIAATLILLKLIRFVISLRFRIGSLVCKEKLCDSVSFSGSGYPSSQAGCL
jgi:hypothetical protein